MRGVIVGGAGFLGGHLIDALKKNNHDVVCIDRDGCDTSYPDSLNIPVLKGDILDRNSIEKHLEEGDVIFHVAALLGVAKANKERYFEMNVDGAANVLQAAINKKAKAFVFPSSFGTVGPVGHPDRPMTEETTCRPDTMYGESKLAAEQKISEIGEGKITCLLFRAPPLFGPRSSPNTGASILFRNMRKKTLFIIGNMQNYFPICYIKNFAAAMVTFAETKTDGIHKYLIADGPPVRLIDILMLTRNEFGTNRRVVRIPFWLVMSLAWALEMVGKLFRFTPLLSRDVVRGLAKSVYFYDISKAHDDGYRPVATLAEGIHETAEWMKSQER